MIDLCAEDESRKLRRNGRRQLARQERENLLGRGADEMQHCNRAALGIVIAGEHRVLA